MANADIAAYISAGVAAGSLVVSVIAIFVAGRASNLNKSMFKRQGIIDLHMAWRGVNDIDVNNIVTPDVVNAVNALDLTASLWNHDVIEKIVIYQSYWRAYKSLYEALQYSQNLAPGTNKKLCDFLSPEVKKAYEDMDKFIPVQQTSL